MLASEVSFERIALNRVTFGARDTDVAYATQIGWEGWVEEQLAPPPGDDPQLAGHLASQTLPISYAAGTNESGGWAAVNEVRPLNYLNKDVTALWDVVLNGNKTIAPAERGRVAQELAAATWIRNTHSKYQIREFLVDFWHNHFNVGKEDDAWATVTLPVYDREAIRPHVLGNFRDMLEANATSTAMLIYLDNFASNAATPNENYARELMELHTLGSSAYYGKTAPGGWDTSTVFIPKLAEGFTDKDVLQASRALSGWTLEAGQRSGNVRLPNTGKFIYRTEQHNTQAGKFLGLDLPDNVEPMAQGRKLLDILATHHVTAQFICKKLCRRIFGDAPPDGAYYRAVTAWMTHRFAPDQLKKVMEAILLDGDEIGTGPQVKIRRPYERLIAMLRTTDTVVNATRSMTSMLDALKDGLFAWPAPNGRPDVNGYWLNTGAMLTTWNLSLNLLRQPEFQTSLYDQTPLEDAGSATRVVEYWVDRMVGYELRPETMDALVLDQSGHHGVPSMLKSKNTTAIENSFHRLVLLITMTEEFSYR